MLRHTTSILLVLFPESVSLPPLVGQRTTTHRIVTRLLHSFYLLHRRSAVPAAEARTSDVSRSLSTGCSRSGA